MYTFYFNNNEHVGNIKHVFNQTINEWCLNLHNKKNRNESNKSQLTFQIGNVCEINWCTA